MWCHDQKKLVMVSDGQQSLEIYRLKFDRICSVSNSRKSKVVLWFWLQTQLLQQQRAERSRRIYYRMKAYKQEVDVVVNTNFPLAAD